MPDDRPWPPPENPPEGVYVDEDEHIIATTVAASKSRAWKVVEGKSLAEIDYDRRNPKEPTREMVLGSAFHMRLLEPEKYGRRVAAGPCSDRRTKEWKAFAAAYEGGDVTLLTAEEFDRIEGACGAVMNHPTAGALMEALTQREWTAYWAPNDPYSDDAVPIKARIDGYSDPLGCLLDIKTTNDLGWDALERHIYSMGYEAQMGLYAEMLRGLEVPVRDVVLIWTRLAPPYPVRIVRLIDDILQHGFLRLWPGLVTYAGALRDDRWPGYDTEIKPMGVPAWALRKYTD